MPVMEISHLFLALGVLAGATAVVLFWRWLLDPVPAGIREARAGRRKQAQRLLAEGKPARAGELFVEAGELDLAVETFRDAGMFSRAAAVLERAGDLHGALETHELGGDTLAAARLAERLGYRSRAARRFEEAGQWHQAARGWQAQGELSRAGYAWWRAGEYLPAAQAYERAGQPLEAARAYRELLQTVDDGPEEGPRCPAGFIGDLVRSCGRCFAEAGDPQAAADVYAGAGFDAEAAELYEECGNLVGGAAAKARLGDFSAAAVLLELAGQSQEAAALFAKAHLAEGDEEQAAAQLERSGDWEAAGHLRARTGAHDKAAELFERAERWAAAATAWEQADEPARAAAAWEQAGETAQAAERYREARLITSELRLRELSGEWLRVGELRLRRGRLDAAVNALRRVEVADPAYRRACRLLGEVYLQRGELSAAAVKFRMAVDGLLPSAETAETYYLAGACACRAGDWSLALPVLSALRDWDPTYRRVQELYERAQRGVTDEAARTDRASARYERLAVLGQGAMGTVHRAVDVVLQREVALKVVSAPPGGFSQPREWLLREARAAAALNHPNIVTVHDCGAGDDELFIAMELVEGSTLQEVLAVEGPLAEEALAGVARQAAGALGYAHERGVIHRDIKPANLMWTPDGRLKIADFGLAKVIRAAQEPTGDTLGTAPFPFGRLTTRRRSGGQDTTQSRQVGTPGYMSPEQILAVRIGPAADQYSLGVTLFELATGRLPFRGEDAPRLHLEATPPTPSELRPGLPGWLDALVLRCLGKRPEDRFPSARDLAASLPEAGETGRVEETAPRQYAPLTS